MTDRPAPSRIAKDSLRLLCICAFVGAFAASPAGAAGSDGEDAPSAADAVESQPASVRPGQSTADLPTSTSSIGTSPRAQRAATQSKPATSGPKIPDDARTKALVDRIKARWALKIERDFAKMYEFETPTYRANTDADAFVRRYGALTQWHGIDVYRVVYADDGAADVQLVSDHTYTSPLDDQSHRTTSLIRERWVQVDDVWYHTVAADPFEALAGSADLPTGSGGSDQPPAMKPEIPPATPQ